MECIRGKTRYHLFRTEVEDLLARYERTWIDVGTGDGRFVEVLGRKDPSHFVVGLDSCRENLRVRSRRALTNIVFVAASACDMPPELAGLVDDLSINFPWGSLLRGLLHAESTVWQGIRLIGKPSAGLVVRMNAEALNREGLDLECGAGLLNEALLANRFRIGLVEWLDRDGLRSVSTTWSKRLAFGRDPRGLAVTATRFETAGATGASRAPPAPASYPFGSPVGRLIPRSLCFLSFQADREGIVSVVCPTSEFITSATWSALCRHQSKYRPSSSKHGEASCWSRSMSWI